MIVIRRWLRFDVFNRSLLQTKQHREIFLLLLNSFSATPEIPRVGAWGDDRRRNVVSRVISSNEAADPSMGKISVAPIGRTKVVRGPVNGSARKAE